MINKFLSWSLFFLCIMVTLPLNGYIYDLTIQVVEEGTLYAHWHTNQPRITGGVIWGEKFPESESTPVEYKNRQPALSESTATFHRMVIIKDFEPEKIYSFIAYTIDPITDKKNYSLEFPLKIGKSNDRLYSVPLPVRGPRIAFTNPGGVAFDIESNMPSNLEFWVQDKDSRQINSLNFSGKTRFSFRIDNLDQGEQYRYHFTLTHPDAPEIKYTSPSHPFSTTKPQGEGFRFAFMSDSRSGKNQGVLNDYNGVAYSTLQPLAMKAKQKDIDFLIFGGNLINGYTPDRRESHLQFQTWIQALAPVWSSMPVYPAAGNHDAAAPRNAGNINNSMESLWREIFVLPTNGPLNPRGLPDYLENVYAFDYGDAYFLILNPYHNLSNLGRPGAYNKIIDEQLTWLEAYLRLAVQQDYTYIIIVSHAPAFPLGDHYGSTLDQHPEERDRFWNLLQKFKVDLYLCGHENIYSRLHVNEKVYPDARHKIPQITSGRTGAPPYQLNEQCPYVDQVLAFSPENNFVIFEVSPQTLQMKAYDEEGTIIDEAEYFPQERDQEKLLALEEERVRITRVIDGDTLETEDRRRIRNIGIDAPEIEKHWLNPPEPGEPFSEEAKQFVEDKILNKEVILKFDADRQDRFGRTLAYVFYEEEGEKYHLENELVRKGLSSIYTVSPHFAFTDRMIKSQNKAMDEKIGIWILEYEESADYYVSSYYFHRFHLPGCRSVDMIELPYRVYHETIEDALRLGLSPCRGCQPLDIMAASDNTEE